MAATPSTLATAETTPYVKKKDNSKQLIITEDLHKQIGDILAIYIEVDKQAKHSFKSLCKPSTVEQPEDIAKLSNFLNKPKPKDVEKEPIYLDDKKQQLK